MAGSSSPAWTATAADKQPRGQPAHQSNSIWEHTMNTSFFQHEMAKELRTLSLEEVEAVAGAHDGDHEVTCEERDGVIIVTVDSA